MSSVSARAIAPATARQHMIDGLLAPNGIVCERVIAAIGVVDRSAFVPAAQAACAYVDAPIALSPERSLMSVLSLAKLLQLLALQEHEKLLIVGGNLGYSAAVCAHLGTDVWMLEEVAPWVLAAKEALTHLHGGPVSVVQTPLAGGLAAEAPYHAILMDGAIETLPTTLIDQLADGGRLAAIEKHTSQPHLTCGVGDLVLYRKQGSTLTRTASGQAACGTIEAFAKPKTFSL